MKIMYARTIGIFFILLIPYTLFAEGAGRDSTGIRESKVNIGLEGGPNFTHLVQYFYPIPLSARNTLKPTIKSSGGLFFQYNFNTASSVHANIFYERRCLEINDYTFYNQGENVPGKAYIIYNCLTLPVSYRIALNRTFFNAGVYVGYLVRGLLQFQQNFGTARWYMANTKKFYKGVCAGAGYTILRNKLLFVSAELRDNFDLTNKDSFGFQNLVRLNTVDLLFSFGLKL